VALAREQTIPTEQPPLVGEVSANFCGERCRVVSAAHPYGRNLDFLDQRRGKYVQKVSLIQGLSENSNSYNRHCSLPL
jgi:hypothetical protein